MKRLLGVFLVLAMLTFYPSITWGSAAVGYGARAVAMGGAFTAVADDGSAAYWNPAGITQIKYVTFTPAFGVEGKYDRANDLIDTSSGLPEFSNNDIQLASLSYLGFTTKYIGINAFIDLSATATTSSSTMTAHAESYGYGALTFAGIFGDQLMIGINMKTIQATVVESEGNNSGDGKKSTSDGDGTAYDIGILYLLNDETKIGFMGRNIIGTVNWKNWTTITYPGGSTITENTPSENIPRSYVLGIAYNPNATLVLAADVEMIDAWGDANDQTRFHIGMEQTVLWKSLNLRLGAYTNKGEQIGITGGFGFKLGPVLLDTAYVSAKNPGAYLTAGFKF